MISSIQKPCGDRHHLIKSFSCSASPTTGFIVVETPADGSCLYHAVSRSICANTDSVITGIGVREEVANYIISNPDHRLPNGVTLTEQILRETLIEGIITPEDYARNVGTTGQHAGALEVCQIKLNRVHRSSHQIHDDSTLEDSCSRGNLQKTNLCLSKTPEQSTSLPSLFIRHCRKQPDSCKRGANSTPIRRAKSL